MVRDDKSTFWGTVCDAGVGGFEIPTNKSREIAMGRRFPVSTLVRFGGVVVGIVFFCGGAVLGIAPGSIVAIANYLNDRDQM
jgi:hypothetical protein